MRIETKIQGYKGILYIPGIQELGIRPENPLGVRVRLKFLYFIGGRFYLGQDDPRLGPVSTFVRLKIIVTISVLQLQNCNVTTLARQRISENIGSRDPFPGFRTSAYESSPPSTEARASELVRLFTEEEWKVSVGARRLDPDSLALALRYRLQASNLEID
jgi:hypothetical protein